MDVAPLIIRLVDLAGQIHLVKQLLDVGIRQSEKLCEGLWSYRLLVIVKSFQNNRALVRSPHFSGFADQIPHPAIEFESAFLFLDIAPANIQGHTISVLIEDESCISYGAQAVGAGEGFQWIVSTTLFRMVQADDGYPVPCRPLL
ncbi:hypothetical protein BCY90_17465 [Agrobacterium deltaense]|nr:hypothetical protein L901_26340 [Agrobacterium sp. D14]RKF41593.1 hypothetical protein BCY90_17465 [Agrobacterium deltaense]